jgi:hypothetical protein
MTAETSWNRGEQSTQSTQAAQSTPDERLLATPEAGYDDQRGDQTVAARPAEQQESPSTDELAEEIARTREALGETVGALAAKADVKARVSDFAADAGERARVSAREHRTQLMAVGAGALVVFALIMAWRQRRP